MEVTIISDLITHRYFVLTFLHTVVSAGYEMVQLMQ